MAVEKTKIVRVNKVFIIGIKKNLRAGEPMRKEGWREFFL